MKTYIHEEIGLGEPDLIKLIHTGKVLKDDQTVSGAGIKDGTFIVVMVGDARARFRMPPVAC